MRKYLASILLGFLVSCANPVVEDLAVQQPPITEAIHPGCQKIENIVGDVAESEQRLAMKVVLCKIAPSPQDILGVYVVEILVKENGAIVSYGLMSGDIGFIGETWEMVTAPVTMLAVDYALPEPETKDTSR